MRPLNYAQRSLLKLLGSSFLFTSIFWLWLFWAYQNSKVGLLASLVLTAGVLAHGVAAIIFGKKITQMTLSSARIKQSIKRLLKRAHAAERRCQHITDFLLEGVIIIDEESRLLFANKMACNLLRLENTGEISMAEAIREPEFHEIVALAFKQKESVEKNITLVDAKSSKLLVRALFINNKSLLITLLDSTRTSSLDEMQSNFLAHASHELKTPISVILANTELLIDSPKLAAEDRPLINAIHRQGVRTKLLLDSLLELFRLDAGPSALPFELVDIRQFVDDLKASIGHLGVLIVNDIAENTMWWSDRALLERLALILIENTKKYAGNDARLWIKSQRLNEGLKIQFCDNGPGIRRHLRERVFERFYRQPEHVQSAGFGLGLAQARAIVTALGGRIFVEPEAGCVIAAVFPDIVMAMNGVTAVDVHYRV